MSHGVLQQGELTAVIGDNSAEGDHRAGYNGIWSLTHRTQDENLFVPAYAGFNLEHLFDGDRCDSGDRATFFEPRHAPMRFVQLSASECELHQPATPVFGVESTTHFKLVAPHYVDVTIRCTLRKDDFRYGYLGLFWASYINAPEDRSIHFRNRGIWQQLCTQAHCRASCVRHENDTLSLPHREGIGDALFMHDSSLRYDESFFYGTFHNHQFVQIFETGAPIRFAHSPGGGGLNQDGNTFNPAWDFMMIIPRCQAGDSSSLRSRIIYRERCTREELLREVSESQAILS